VPPFVLSFAAWWHLRLFKSEMSAMYTAFLCTHSGNKTDQHVQGLCHVTITCIQNLDGTQSGHIFGLVMWITIYVYCSSPYALYDDMWSYEMDPTLSFYKLYMWVPQKQVKLLWPYDELGLHMSRRTGLWPFTQDIGLGSTLQTWWSQFQICLDMTSTFLLGLHWSKSSRQCLVIEEQWI